MYPSTHTALEDYRFASGGFAFPPSTSPSQQQCRNIDILDDATYESTEQLSVNLSTSVSRVNLITTSLQIEIEDNDRVVVGLNQTEFAVVEELQSGDVSFTVCTVLTGSIEKTVVVRLFSEHISSGGKPFDRCAVPPKHTCFKDDNFPDIYHFSLSFSFTLEHDYTALDELLTFEPSEAIEQSICHPVIVHDDRLVEGAEFFRLLLTSSDPVVILNPASATVTITEGDGEFILFVHQL